MRWRLQKATEHHIGRSRLNAVLAIYARHGRSIAGDEPYFGRQVVRVDDQQLTRWIVRRAAPVHPAEVARIHERAVDTRRREDAVVSKTAHEITAGRPIRVRRSPGVVRSD